MMTQNSRHEVLLQMSRIIMLAVTVLMMTEKKTVDYQQTAASEVVVILDYCCTPRLISFPLILPNFHLYIDAAKETSLVVRFFYVPCANLYNKEQVQQPSKPLQGTANRVRTKTRIQRSVKSCPKPCHFLSVACRIFCVEIFIIITRRIEQNNPLHSD